MLRLASLGTTANLVFLSINFLAISWISDASKLAMPIAHCPPSCCKWTMSSLTEENRLIENSSLNNDSGASSPTKVMVPAFEQKGDRFAFVLWVGPTRFKIANADQVHGEGG